MGRLIMFEQHILVTDDYNYIKKQVQLEVEPFTPENFPEYYEAGIVPHWLNDWGAPPLTTRAFLTDAKVSNRY